MAMTENILDIGSNLFWNKTMSSTIFLIIFGLISMFIKFLIIILYLSYILKRKIENEYM